MNGTGNNRENGTRPGLDWSSSMTSFLRPKGSTLLPPTQRSAKHQEMMGYVNEEDEDVDVNDETNILQGEAVKFKDGVAVESRRGLLCCYRKRKVDLDKIEKWRRERAWVDDYRSASLPSRFLFAWCSRLEKESLEREVEVNDLWNSLDSEKCDVVTERVRTAWDYERKTSAKPSLFRALLRAFKYEIWRTGFYKSLWLVAIILTNAVFFNSTLKVLQRFVANPNQVPTVQAGTLQIPYEGFYWAIAFGLSDICRSLFINAQWWSAGTTGLKARIGVANLVFDKLTRTRQVGSVGEVVTHTTSDVQRIFDAFTYGMFIISTPVSMIVIVIVGSFYLSVAFVVGLALLILFLPIQVKISTRSQLHHRKAVRISSERVTLMSEILRAIKLVKLYGWGPNFSSKVNVVREEEMKELQKGASIRSINQAVSFTTPALVVACAFAVHTLGLGKPLIPSEAFTTVALLNAARFPLSVLPNATRCLSECLVACRRLERFLLMDNDVVEVEDAPTVDGDVIFIRKGEFSWFQAPVQPQSPSSRNNTKTEPKLASSAAVLSATGVRLIVPSLNVKRGKLTMVTGKLGSGKTSLLAGALLGEMRMDSCESFGIKSKGGIAYVSQNPFIFNGTVKQNILMATHSGEPVDEDRLGRVIKACCLEQDLAAFPAGLDTELGERGINGSGGQKTRIALARALYAAQSHELLILDDVFSALDAHVRKRIWIEIRHGDLLKNNTVLLATHWGEILKESDFLVAMHNNEVVMNGVTYADLVSKGEWDTFLNLIGCVLDPDNADDASSSDAGPIVGLNDQTKDETPSTPKENAQPQQAQAPPQQDTKKFQGKLVQTEARAKGSIEWSTIRKLVFRGDLRAFTTIALIAMIISELVIALGVGLWISSWTQNFFHKDAGFYVGIMFAITGAMFLLTEIRGLLFARMMLKGALRVHDEAFETLMSAKLSFFDITPMGRVLSRFSADMDTMDVNLPEVVETALSLIIRSIFSFIIVAVVFVWFLIPLFVLAIMFIALFMRFRPSIRMMKRIDITSKSPVLSLVESTAYGLTTLRAYGVLNRTRMDAESNWNLLFKTAFAFNATSRFMAVRLDLITSVSTVLTACFCILFASSATPGLAGLALSSVLQTGGIFQFAIRQLMEAESMFSSVERLVSFTDNVPKESEYFGSRPSGSLMPGASTKTILALNGQPVTSFSSVATTNMDAEDPAPQTMLTAKELDEIDWKGRITFDNVFARYRARLPFVLRGLSFDIPGGSSCGLVGRTGSGKSSCLLALFRIFNSSRGVIAVDGIDVGSIPLAYLRSKLLSIIPQDPSLFRGTIRSNLDPFGLFSDAEIRDALTKVHLHNKKEMMENIDGAVDESGSNLSQGERQLFCLARSLLRNTPVVCLDECTSSVDSETSRLIGDTLKQLFKGRTLVIVAHRLDVVSSLDQVCVLERGVCVENGDPVELIASQKGMFFELWRSAQSSSSGE